MKKLLGILKKTVQLLQYRHIIIHNDPYSGTHPAVLTLSASIS